MKNLSILTRARQGKLVWTLAILAAILPAVLTFLLIRFDLHTSLSEFYPVQWLDQSDYWHEALTFKEVGFKGGYYGQGEEITPLARVRFGTHGPLYPILFGSLARMTGWEFSSPVYINMALLALGVLIFVGLAKPKPFQTLLLIPLMGLYAPVLYYLPTVLQESLQQAAALVLAGMFADLFRRNGKNPNMRLWIYFIFLFILSVSRFSWGVLFLPFLYLAWPRLAVNRLIWMRMLIYVGISAGLIGLVFWISWLVTAPGADSIVMTVETMRVSPLQGFGLIVTWLSANLVQLFTFKSWISLSLRIQNLGLLGYAGFTALKAARRSLTFTDEGVRLACFHIVNLMPLSLALLTIYFLETDVRILGPHLLLSLTLMICFSEPRPFLLILLVSLLSFPCFLSEYRELSPSFNYNKERLLETRRIITSNVVYRPQAPAPWCNTLLISKQYYDETLLSMPAGVGVTFIWPGRTKRMEMPLKSAYLILDDEKYGRLYHLGNFETVELAVLPNGGRLFRNPLSACPLP